MEFNLNGLKFGRLTIINDLGVIVKKGNNHKKHYVRCKCDCGNEVEVALHHIKNGDTKSCGCLAKEIHYKTHKRNNEYYVYEDIVFVKFSNCEEYFLCDLKDWKELKKYCWRKDKDGYAIARVSGSTKRMHRLIVNCPDDMEVDHIYQVSRGVLDNRKTNLIVATHSENMINRSLSKRNVTNCNGVTLDKRTNKWIANIGFKGKTIYLGSFDKLDKAIEVRKRAEIKYWGKENIN